MEFRVIASLQPRFPIALLALADGTVFTGFSFGASGHSRAELVFNTAMTGYQEILSDPSYARQIVLLTYPHIGNYGCTDADMEARAVFAAGLVVKDIPLRHSNFRAQSDLPSFMQAHGVQGIGGVDTRKLTRHLRVYGNQNACILALAQGETLTAAHSALALQLAQTTPSMVGQDLAKVVSCPTPYTWSDSTWQLGRGSRDLAAANQGGPHVVAYDFGIKHNILRILSDRGCRITVVPATTSAAQALALQPDGIFLSNGPGDPEPCAYAIAATQVFLERNIPLFGICLGHQILALACGASTYKMKFGHHGVNHPVRNLDQKNISITSQNHGFAVDAKSLPAQLRITHISLFDDSVQGLAHTQKPAFGFQGHPEASPGPQDIVGLFDQFRALLPQ